MTTTTQPTTASRSLRPPAARLRPRNAGAAAHAAPCPAGHAQAGRQRAAIGQLAASIAHEVDQPLAAIALHAHAALRCIERAKGAEASGDAADRCASDAQAAIHALLQASTQASDIVSSMRALAGSARPVRVRVRLDMLLDEVLAAYAGDIERLGIECRLHFGRGARSALAHPVQLRQLLRNLVANAIDALRTVDGRPRRIGIAARLDGAGGLRVTVRDNGIGMDAGQAGRVFEPLVTTKASGLGLGLAICRAIAEAHGGRIWAAPLAAHGCEFSLLLPHDAAQRSPTHAFPIEARHG